MNIRSQLSDFIHDESGQSVTEYGAIIAFVGLIVAMVFGLARGTLFQTICQSYSGVVSQMDTLNSYASSSS
jgi:Flp pilus assembly pilin Flp